MEHRWGRQCCVIVLLWSMVVAFPKVVLGAHVSLPSAHASAHHHDELALSGGHYHAEEVEVPAEPHSDDHLHESGYPAHHLPVLMMPVLLTPVPYYYSKLPYIDPPPRRPPRLS